MRFRQLLPLFGALFALYIIWGSTYLSFGLAWKAGLPLMMAGVRYLAAGILLLAFLLLRDKLPATSAAQCRADWPVIAGCR